MFSFLKRSRKPSPACRKINPFRPSFEALETREVLSVTVPGFTLDNGGNLYNTSGAQQQLIDTGVRSFALANNQVCDLHYNSVLESMNSDGSGLVVLDLNVQSFAVNGAGHVVDLETNGGLYEFTAPASTSSWVRLDYNVQSFAVNGAGHVVDLDTNGCRYEFTDAGSNGPCASGVTASDGSIWFLGTATVDSAGDYAIYRLSNGQVTQMPGFATQLGNSSGAVLALDGSGNLSVATPQGLSSVFNTNQTQIAGFSLGGQYIHLDNNGISFSLYIPEYGQITFTGSYDPSTGQWVLDAYPLDFRIGYVELTHNHLKLTNSGLTVDCLVSAFGIPQLANAKCHGQIYSDGRFISTVDGSALQVGGFTLSNTTINLSNDNPSHLMQLSMHGTLGFLGLTSSVDGYLDAQGTFDLKSSAALNLAGYTISSMTFQLNNTGLTVSGSLQVGALGSVSVKGSVSSNGNFSLTGSNNLGSITISNGGVAVSVNNPLNAITSTLGISL
jgi:hypothetical protein